MRVRSVTLHPVRGALLAVAALEAASCGARSDAVQADSTDERACVGEPRVVFGTVAPNDVTRRDIHAPPPDEFEPLNEGESVPLWLYNTWTDGSALSWALIIRLEGIRVPGDGSGPGYQYSVRDINDDLIWGGGYVATMAGAADGCAFESHPTPIPVCSMTDSWRRGPAVVHVEPFGLFCEEVGCPDASLLIDVGCEEAVTQCEGSRYCAEGRIYDGCWVAEPVWEEVCQ